MTKHHAPAPHQDPLPALLYQGAANAWECDEMGHLNVRFHVERAMLGIEAMAAELGMPNAFKASPGATLLPLEAHIRFLREARPGAPLLLRGGVVELGESDATLYCELRHIDGTVSSTFRLRVAHAEPRSLKAFPWSRASRAAAGKLRCEVPAHGAPRSIDLAQTPAQISGAQADALGVRRTGRSVIAPAECDSFGRMRGENFIARVSDAVPWLLADFRAEAAAQQSDGVERKPGGAAVEFRIVFRAWPRPGDHLEVRSAVTEVMEKANRIVHWVLDPTTGAAWASVEAVAITFDLNTRKAYVAPQAVRAEFAKRAIGAMKV